LFKDSEVTASHVFGRAESVIIYGGWEKKVKEGMEKVRLGYI